MADITIPFGGGTTAPVKRYKDMGDGTWAEVVTVAGLTVTADSINLDTADLETKIGALTEAAPATDTASSGLNGRLQRLAQRITSLIAQIPTALTSLGNFKVAVQEIGNDEYETVAASQTAQVLGATGATGDYISGLLVIPATVSPGNVLLLDNATSITVFTGGTNSVGSLVPFLIPLGMKSVSGAWKVTTGANVSVIGVGNFT